MPRSSGDLEMTQAEVIYEEGNLGQDDAKFADEWLRQPRMARSNTSCPTDREDRPLVMKASISEPPRMRSPQRTDANQLSQRHRFDGNQLSQRRRDGRMNGNEQDTIWRISTLGSLASLRVSTMTGAGTVGGNRRVRFKTDLPPQPTLLFSPHDPFVMWWKGIEVVFLSISFFRLPMVMAFGAEYLIWDISPELYFSLDHILSLNTGFYRKDELVMDRNQIIKRWFDWEHFMTGDRGSVYVFMMEFFPFYMCIIAMHYVTIPFWVLSLCALPRCRRIGDLLAFFSHRERDLTKDVRWTALFKYTLALLGSGHWLACLWWLLARVSNFSKQSWVMQYMTTLHRTLSMDFAGSLYNYGISLLWGYSTLSGVGYLGYLPTTTLESIFFVGMTLVSVVVHSFLFGILLHYIVRKDVAQEKYKSMMDQVEKYSSMYKLPRKLEDAIKLFYTFQYKKKVGADEEVMKSIPVPLKMKIMVYQYQLVAMDKVFTGCQEQFVSAVLSLLKPKILIPGTQIYLKDDVSREVCFIERGEVEVYDDDVLVSTLKVTEERFPAVGEVSFFLGIPQVYTFTASTKSEVKLLTLSKEDYEEVKDRFPDARDILINNVKAQVFAEKEEDDLQLEITVNPGNKKDSAAQELRKRVREALRTKLDDDVATMFNAIRDGYVDDVKLLLSKGFNPNATDYDKRTSLHFAAVSGDDKIVELLLQHHADIHTKDRWGRNAFRDAVDNNHRKVIQQLAAQGAELELQNAAGRLCSAAFADDLFELQHLVENGIDANSADYDGRTALHLSACEGNSKIVEFLLLPMSKGDPNVTDRWGVSPLLDAIRHGNHAVARILHENGARLAIEHAASFMCTAAAEGDSRILGVLAECGLHVNICDYDNRYPIHVAAAEGEVVSVHFLTYAHSNVSVKDRWGRTPLDDALVGRHWMCAKLLLSFGGKRTVAFTPEAQEAIDAIEMEEITELVRAEKDTQKERKDTEKQLRDNVKWMIADADTWLKSLDERMHQLDRVVEKYMSSMDDEEQCAREAGLFLEQLDEQILISERPEGEDGELAIGRGKDGGKNYLLSRYFRESVSNSSSTAIGSGKTLKSMQHFFLKLGLIEKVLFGFKKRVREISKAPLGRKARIDSVRLGYVLNSYDLSPSQDQLSHFLECCAKNVKISKVDRDMSTDPHDLRSDSNVQRQVTFDELLTSVPLWRYIAGASVAEGAWSSDLKELQEAVRCIFQGFNLMDVDGNGKLSRTEWRIEKRQGDLGDFATAVDTFMEDRDAMTIDTFFLVVAAWSNLADEEPDEEPISSWMSDQSGPVTDCTRGSAWESSPITSTGGDDVRIANGEHHRKPSRRIDELDIDGHHLNGIAIDFDDGHYMELIDLPNGKFQGLSWSKRMLLHIRFRMAERRIIRLIVKDMNISVEDIANRFDRLDTHGRGVLDETRTQLLLSWAFDVDFKAEDWDAIFYYLVGEKSCFARRHNILTWTTSLLKRRPRQTSRFYSFVRLVADSGRALVHRISASNFIIDHTGSFSRKWKVIRAVVALYMFLTVPYQIAFLRESLLGRYFPSLIVSWAFDVLMMLDIVLKFNMSFTDERSLKVFDRSRIRNRYLQTDFVLDFVAVIPLDFLVSYYDRYGDSVVAWLRVTKVLHAPKLYRTIRRQSRERSSAIARLMADIQFLYCVSLALIHIMACIWYYITEDSENFEGVGGYSFLGEPLPGSGNDGGGPFKIRYYIYCVTVVVYVVSSNGMPTNITGAPGEVWFLTLTIVLNLSFWAYLMGSISGLFISADEKVAELHEQMGSCVRFIKYNNIPEDLGHELKNFFSLDANQKTSLSLTEQNRVYRNLPQSIQVQLARHISRDLLLQVDIFRNCSDYFLDAVSTLLRVEVVAPGEYLFKAGAVCRSLLIIASGTAETVKVDSDSQQWTVQGTHEPGDALGQLEFCFDTRYMTSARVTSGGDMLRVFHLQKVDFTRMVKLFPKDEDIIQHNLSNLSDEDRHETGSVARSAYSGTSYASLESTMRSVLDEAHIERAMADIDKAKLRSQEQRVRSFCNAASAGDLDALSRLVNSGMDVNGRDTNGRTALMLATCSGNMEAIKYLIFKGADLNAKDKFGGSALLDALKGNHTEVMAFFKDRGAVLELEDAAGTLCLLAAKGQKEQLRLLLSLGADPNVADYDKRTPLHLAASEGHLECVELLLGYWADVNPLDRMKGTPLTDSVRRGHYEVQKYLRQRGGRLIIDPTELGTTLCEGAASGDLQKIQILAENGANINQGDYDHRTALHLAACCNKLSVIEYLVNIPGIDINPFDRCCCTPLDDALRENQEAIASILKKHGGLQGQDPRLDEARRLHLEARAEAHNQKLGRKEQKLAVFRQQLRSLERIMEIYHTSSEHLPPLFKYMNLLSVTLRSRRNTSVVDRTPHPTLQELRFYFCISFHAYLDQRYIKVFDNFLTLCEQYVEKEHLGEKALVAEKVFQMLDSRSRGYINLAPEVVDSCREQFRDGLAEGLLPQDLLVPLESCVKNQLEEVLPDYFISKEFYTACRKRNGFLWRVIKLSRLAYKHSSILLEKGVRPLLEMGDRGELECVPLISPQNRAKFRLMCERLDQHLVRLKKSLHIVAYLSKDVCVREQLREGHTNQALGHKGPDGRHIRRNA